MEHISPIDTTFDFQSDTPPGKDPDAFSPTLRRYHQILWSKPLPGGFVFELVDTTPRVYLHHHSELGEFWLTSDTVIPSFWKEKRIAHIIKQIPEEMESFFRIGYSIGGMMVFPGNCVDRHMTINAARGCNHLIKDRFDLTVECIRRYYLNEDSPLRATLERYSDFFHLFGDFRGYVEFFLLQDLVTSDFSAVKFFMLFEDFKPFPIPDSMEAYLDYRAHAISFIQSRNHRISNWWKINRTG
jgi:hypothetical protein